MTQQIQKAIELTQQGLQQGTDTIRLLQSIDGYLQAISVSCADMRISLCIIIIIIAIALFMKVVNLKK